MNSYSSPPDPYNIKNNRVNDVFSKLRIFVLVAILIIPVIVNAQDDLELLNMKIDSLASDVIASGKAAGLSITVTRNGKTILSQGYGYADLAKKTPVQNNTMFRIASITKQFTAVSILQLVEQQKIHLDDPITRFIPDYPTHGYTITIQELLNHTSGIKNITALGAKYWSQIDSEITPTDLISMFKNEPFDFKPGEHYSYNNSGYILLGYIIEKVTGLSYADYINKNIITPLGLKSTHYNPDSTKFENLSKTYSYQNGKLVKATAVNLTQGYSEGGICSTTEDLTKFVLSLHSGKLISDKLYKEMIIPQRLPNGEFLNYGFGIGIGEVQGHPLLFHAGGIFGADAQAIYFPKDKISIVILSNTDNSGVMNLENKISSILLNLKEPKIENLTIKEKERYLGKYHRGNFEVEVLLSGKQLTLKGMWDENPVTLYYIGNNAFRGEGQLENIKFSLKNGKAEYLRLTHYGAVIAEFERMK